MKILEGHSNDLIDCPDCGTLQRFPDPRGWTVLFCARCKSVLQRSYLRNQSAALAVTLCALFLMLPSVTLTFLTTSVAGATRSSVLGSSAIAMFQDGWPLLGAVIFLFTIVAPLLRFSLLSVVLGLLQVNLRPPWLGTVFRYSNALQIWAMADVYLLGLAVAYARLKASLNVELGTGAKCYIAVGLCSLLIRALLDERSVWQKIGVRVSRVGARASEPEPAARAVMPAHPLTCTGCELITPPGAIGQRCPRCSKPLHWRKPEAIGKAVALTIAGCILYIPANTYPIATLPIGFSSVRYTILQGVVDLAQARLWDLALLVFTASFAIPLLKLTGLLWCLVSVTRHSTAWLPLKTHVFRGIEEIGRWSMIDPFVISCFVPVTHYNALIYGHANAAAPAFTAVVILTIIATKCFDPRLLWDVQETP